MKSGLSQSRRRHSTGVARVARHIAEQYYDKPTADPQALFMLGLVHDIGYAYCDHQSDHAQRGGDVLRDSGYQYWREVYHHGQITDYQSAELDILNGADMCVGPDGQVVQPEQRLRDIRQRYGPESDQHKQAQEVVGDLERRLDFFDQQFVVDLTTQTE